MIMKNSSLVSIDSEPQARFELNGSFCYVSYVHEAISCFSEASGQRDETFLPTYIWKREERFGHGFNINLRAGYCVRGSPFCAVLGQMIRWFVPGWCSGSECGF